MGFLPGAASGQYPGWSPPYGSILDNPQTAAQGRRALVALYDMDLGRATLIIDSLKTRHPGHPVGPFLEALVIWWQILPNLEAGDKSLDKPFFRAMDRTVEAADRLSKDRYPLDKVFFKAAALGFRGRHLSNRREWLSAAKDGKGALDLVFELSRRDPKNPDFQFGVGAYNYFAAVIPEEYPVVRPLMLFFPDGDRELGLQLLEKAAAQATFVGTEAAYFLLQIYLAYKPSYDDAMRMVSLMRTRHPSNAFFHVLEGRVHVRWGRWDKANAIYEAVLAKHAAGVRGYSDGLAQNALYYLGRGHMAAGRLEDSIHDFDRLERMTTGNTNSSYRALGRLRAGMAHDRLGNRRAAQAAYRKVLELPEVSNSHDLAKRYLKRPFGT